MSSYTKLSISLPVELAIKVDLERSDSYQSRSSWVREAIEQKLIRNKQVKKESETQEDMFMKE